MFKKWGAQAALIKLGFGMPQAEKVLALATKKQLPKASYKILIPFQELGLGPRDIKPFREALVGPMGSAPAKYQARALHLGGPLRQRMISSLPQNMQKPMERFATGFQQTLKEKAPQGAIIARGSKIPLIKRLSEATGVKGLTPENQKMFEGVIKGTHELGETQVYPEIGAMPFMHNSPEVLLREHNALATLPPEHAKVRELMQATRAMGPEPAMLKEMAGLPVFGEGRVSRHARKHMTELMNKGVLQRLQAGGVYPQNFNPGLVK